MPYSNLQKYTLEVEQNSAGLWPKQKALVGYIAVGKREGLYFVDSINSHSFLKCSEEQKEIKYILSLKIMSKAVQTHMHKQVHIHTQTLKLSLNNHYNKECIENGMFHVLTMCVC